MHLLLPSVGHIQTSQAVVVSHKAGVLSQCLEFNGKICSQGFLTKAFLSFREHQTNIAKLYDGECKQEIVSAVQVKNLSLRAAVESREPHSFP